MTKTLTLSFILLISSNAFSRPCEVYGISDSPQTLDCTFKTGPVAVRCHNGDYYLNDSKVKMAYHLEVEEGPTPLVFRAPDLQLTVTLQTKAESVAQLDKNGRLIKGRCQ